MTPDSSRVRLCQFKVANDQLQFAAGTQFGTLILSSRDFQCFRQRHRPVSQGLLNIQQRFVDCLRDAQHCLQFNDQTNAFELHDPIVQKTLGKFFSKTLGHQLATVSEDALDELKAVDRFETALQKSVAELQQLLQSIVPDGILLRQRLAQEVYDTLLNSEALLAAFRSGLQVKKEEVGTFLKAPTSERLTQHQKL